MSNLKIVVRRRAIQTTSYENFFPLQISSTFRMSLMLLYSRSVLCKRVDVCQAISLVEGFR
jgi:hypothetical protein